MICNEQLLLDQSMNPSQCDGCAAYMPIIDGIHYNGAHRHMTCTNGKRGLNTHQAETAKRLYMLSNEMRSLALSLAHYNKQHSEELAGAAEICTEWGNNIIYMEVDLCPASSANTLE